MVESNEVEESQGSQELARLLASGGPAVDFQDVEPESVETTTHFSSDTVESNGTPLPRYSFVGLQDIPMSQTRVFDTDEEEEEEQGPRSSQKENFHSSTDSAKLGPNVLCSSDENTLARSKKPPNKNQFTLSSNLRASHSTRTRSQPDHPSVLLNKRSDSVKSPGGLLGESREPASRPEETSEPDMLRPDYGSSSPSVLARLSGSVQPSPVRRQQESQSSNGSQVSRVGGFDSQDEDEPHAQNVIEQYDMSFVRQTYPDTPPPQESQAIEATQSTQPADHDEQIVQDSEWLKWTGIQVPPERRGQYLRPAKEGAANRQVLNDTFFDGVESMTSTPANVNVDADDPCNVRQYPAGMPEDMSSQEVETQLLPGTEREEEDSSWVPQIQYPAGFGPLPGEENMATQILETETQLLDGDHYEEPASISPAPLVHPSAHPATAEVSTNLPPLTMAVLPKPSHRPNDMEIVPDSEPALPSSPLTPPPADDRQLTENAMDVDTEDEKPLADTIVKHGHRKAAGVKGDTSTGQMPPPLPKRSAKAEGKRRQATSLDQEKIEPAPRASSSKRKAAVTPTTVVKSEFATKRKGKQPAKGRESKPSAAKVSGHRRSNRTTRNQRALIESDSEEGDVDEIMDVKEEDAAYELGEDGFSTPGPSTSNTVAKSNKRKRSGTKTATAPRKAPKASSFQTPGQRASRSQSIMSSVDGSHAVILDFSYRILGLSVTNGHWYPGTVLQLRKPDSWKILFYDGSAELAKIGSLRKWELKVGDVVKHAETQEMGEVSEMNEQKAVASGKGGCKFDLPYDKLCIPPEQVEAQWGDRFLDGKAVANIYDMATYSATQSTLSAGADPFLKGCGIIITSNPKAQEWNKEKSEIFASMINNGVSLLEDWTDALQLSGKYVYDPDDDDDDDDEDEDDNNDEDCNDVTPIRWKILKKNIQWFQDTDEPGSLQRVFVIADALCQKPKYLVALALGVPCLSTKWMTDSFNNREGKDWSRYLLPQGICTSIVPNARLSQSVNLDWGTEPGHLTNIMDNPHARKLFDGMSILCVGDDYIPVCDKKRKSTMNDHDYLGPRKIAARSEITSGVALIILAMGASKVNAIANLKDAPKTKASYDFVVFKDPNWKTKVSAPKRQTTYVSWAWVKQSLICGKMMDPMY